MLADFLCGSRSTLPPTPLKDYGLKKNRWRKYYCLDMVKLFESFMRPNQKLVAVKYFSARVEDDGKSLRQNAFFQANQMNPKFKLIPGKYLRKNFKCNQAVLCFRPIHY